MYIYIYIYHCLSKHIVDSVPERVELTCGSGLCNPAIIPNGHIIIPIRFHYTEYVNMQKIVWYISLYTILYIYIYIYIYIQPMLVKQCHKPSIF